jgi:hypothetical protein
MNLNNKVYGEILIQDTSTNPSPGVEYSPLMVESNAEVLVKEERWPEAILVAVVPPIFLWRGPATSPFHGF